MFQYAAHKFIGGTSWVAKHYSNLSRYFSGRVYSNTHSVELYIHTVQHLFKERYDNVTLTNNLNSLKETADRRCTEVKYVYLWRCHPTRAMATSFLRLLDHTQPPTTVGRTALDERSARSREIYLITYNTQNRQMSMPPAGFEPTIAADRAATGTGSKIHLLN
jgi:hypothetical protein